MRVWSPVAVVVTAGRGQRVKWDDRQQAKRIETRRVDRVGVPSDHFAPAVKPRSVHHLRRMRRLVQAAIAQRDAR